MLKETVTFYWWHYIGILFFAALASHGFFIESFVGLVLLFILSQLPEE